MKFEPKFDCLKYKLYTNHGLILNLEKYTKLEFFRTFFIAKMHNKHILKVLKTMQSVWLEIDTFRKFLNEKSICKNNENC